MREQFRGYYYPTKDEFDKAWTGGLIVLDANVLLHMHEYSPAVRDEFLDTLSYFENELWIPHQVGLEYHRNRRSVIERQADIATAFVRQLQADLNRFKEWARKREHNPVVMVSDVIDQLDKVVDEIEQAAAKNRDAYIQLVSVESGFEDDTTLEAITALFTSDRIGLPYDRKQLHDQYKKARERYEVETPPGYSDAKQKGEPGCFGDYILWRQILDHATDVMRPIILVTDDRKPDWWRLKETKAGSDPVLLGPRPELIEEMFSVAAVALLMYEPEDFLRLATRKRGEEASEDTLEEVRSVSEFQTPVRIVGGLAPGLAALTDPDGSIAVALQNLAAVLPHAAIADTAKAYQQILSSIAIPDMSHLWQLPSYGFAAEGVRPNMSALGGYHDTPSDTDDSDDPPDPPDDLTDDGESDEVDV